MKMNSNKVDVDLTSRSVGAEAMTTVFLGIRLWPLFQR